MCCSYPLKKTSETFQASLELLPRMKLRGTAQFVRQRRYGVSVGQLDIFFTHHLQDHRLRMTRAGQRPLLCELHRHLVNALPNAVYG